MTFPWKLVIAGGAGFVLGNTPAADVAGRLAGGDLRSEGTGNPGAMNASHVLGKKWGTAVFAADIGKGFAAARLGNRLGGPTGANLASTLAVVGHCFPVGRTGGKGVATSIGQVAGTFPVYLPLDIGIGVATSALPFLHQRTRAATAVASAAWIGCAALWWRRQLNNPGGVAPTAALPLAAVASSVVIAARFAAEAQRVDAYNAHAGSGDRAP